MKMDMANNPRLSFKTLILSLLLIGGWKRNPIDRLINPLPDGALSQSSHIYVLFDDEVKTGGGIGFIPGGENQTIELRDASSPRSGDNQIRYTWNGQDVSNGGIQQHAFAGFSFTITPDFSTF